MPAEPFWHNGSFRAAGGFKHLRLSGFDRTMIMTKRPAAAGNAAPGERVYAIGDIHGRLDLFMALLAKIREDAAGRAVIRTKVVVLGDVIDRGPGSAQVLNELRRITGISKDLIVLMGNHEAYMIDALHGDKAAFTAWMRFGGRQTLESFGIPSAPDSDVEALLRLARASIDRGLIQWMDRLPVSYRSGDFFFVHAGVRPGVPLNEQDESDLLWITDEFLDDQEDHGAIVVHGHSVDEGGPRFMRNRIGLDTGAYRTGRLSAVGIEADQTWSLST